MRLKYIYSVISVNADSLPGNTKKSGIDPFVADRSAISQSLGGYMCIFKKMHMKCISGKKMHTEYV